MSGQTTYACRPSPRRRVRRVYASDARSSVIQLVITGLREAGGFLISDTARSPYTVSASVRGIGVAGLWGARGGAPPRVAAGRRAAARGLSPTPPAPGARGAAPP